MIKSTHDILPCPAPFALFSVAYLPYPTLPCIAMSLAFAQVGLLFPASNGSVGTRILPRLAVPPSLLRRLFRLSLLHLLLRMP